MQSIVKQVGSHQDVDGEKMRHRAMRHPPHLGSSNSVHGINRQKESAAGIIWPARDSVNTCASISVKLSPVFVVGYKPIKCIYLAESSMQLGGKFPLICDNLKYIEIT